MKSTDSIEEPDKANYHRQMQESKPGASLFASFPEIDMKGMNVSASSSKINGIVGLSPLRVVDIPHVKVHDSAMNGPTREEIDAKLAQLKAEQNALISEIKSSNAAMMSKLDVTVAQVTGIQSGLVGQMDGLKGQMDGLKTAFSGMQSNIGIMIAFFSLAIAGFQIYDAVKEKEKPQTASSTAAPPAIIINVPSPAQPAAQSAVPPAEQPIPAK